MDPVNGGGGGLMDAVLPTEETRGLVFLGLLLVLFAAMFWAASRLTKVMGWVIRTSWTLLWRAGIAILLVALVLPTVCSVLDRIPMMGPMDPEEDGSKPSDAIFHRVVPSFIFPKAKGFMTGRQMASAEDIQQWRTGLWDSFISWPLRSVAGLGSNAALGWIGMGGQFVMGYAKQVATSAYYIVVGHEGTDTDRVGLEDGLKRCDGPCTVGTLHCPSNSICVCSRRQGETTEWSTSTVTLGTSLRPCPKGSGKCMC